MPFELYVAKIEKLSEKAGIICNCELFDRGDSLVCNLSTGNLPIARVTVKAESRTKLEGRYLGIILRNLYKLKNNEIENIVDSGIPFGYLADADIFPTGDIKRELRSRWASSVIKISISPDDLARNNIRANSSEAEIRRLASDLLDRHPNPAFMEIEKSGTVDLAMANELINAAKDRKTGYIYIDENINKVDSMAFAAGLSFLDMSTIQDFSNEDFLDFRANLVSKLLIASEHEKLLLIADISKLGADNYVKLIRYLRNIGINILDINKLDEHPEFMIEDL